MPSTFHSLLSSNKCDKMYVMSLMFNVEYYFTHLQKSSKRSSELLVKDLLIGLFYDGVYGEVTLLEQPGQLSEISDGWRNLRVHLQVTMTT